MLILAKFNNLSTRDKWKTWPEQVGEWSCKNCGTIMTDGPRRADPFHGCEVCCGECHTTLTRRTGGGQGDDFGWVLIQNTASGYDDKQEPKVDLTCNSHFSEGDYVRYKKGKGVLQCGSGSYARAVVASMKPFVLISEWGDMKWSATVEVSKFEKCGEAGREELLSVIDRLKRELYPDEDDKIE